MALAQYSILVVDDNEPSLDLISRYLGKKGYNVSTACCGTDAFAMIDVERFDLILLDIYMPDINGLDILKKLKERVRTKNIPVIMFTSSTDVAHRRTAAELAADDFITKSESLNIIRERILEVLRKRRVYGSETPEQEQASLDSFNLLVVDDDDMSRELLCRRVNKLGYHMVDTASTGEEALQMMKRKRYDMVFLDIAMPGITGIEVLEKIKSDAALESTPVVMVSSNNDSDVIKKCEDLGATNYVVKPFHYSLIKSAIENHLGH